MNNDFESLWSNYYSEVLYKFVGNPYHGKVDKSVAEYFFNAGVASTKKKPNQIPALFKPKEQNAK